MNMLKKEEDRRRFFRITDAIGVAYEVIDDNDTEETESPEQANVDIKDLLACHNNAINDLLSDLSGTHPAVAKTIDAVNKKLDAILQFLELDALSSNQHIQRIEEASISACGIAFPIEQPLALGTRLNLTLDLKPSDEKIYAVGEVVGCQSTDDSHYLRVEFTEMQDAYRESLIQHIVQRQGALLKSLREQLDGME